MEPADPALAAMIRAMRTERGMSQEDVAGAAGLSVGSYARIERGQSNPAWTTVRRIAGAFGVAVADLAAAAERPAR